MKIYTIHEPPVPSADPLDRADELIFVKDGFSLFAFILPVIWLIYHRVWIALIVFLVFSIGLNMAFVAMELNQIYLSIVMGVLSLIIAFEASSLRRWQLDRRDYKLVGSVSGRDLYECESKFFEDWATTAESTSADHVSEAHIPGSPVATNELRSSSFYPDRNS